MDTFKFHMLTPESFGGRLREVDVNVKYLLEPGYHTMETPETIKAKLESGNMDVSDNDDSDDEDYLPELEEDESLPEYEDEPEPPKVAVDWREWLEGKPPVNMVKIVRGKK